MTKVKKEKGASKVFKRFGCWKRISLNSIAFSTSGSRFGFEIDYVFLPLRDDEGVIIV